MMQAKKISYLFVESRSLVVLIIDVIDFDCDILVSRDSEDSPDSPRKEKQKRTEFRFGEIYVRAYSDDAARRRRGVRANIATAASRDTCTEISTVYLHTKTRVKDLRCWNVLIHKFVTCK